MRIISGIHKGRTLQAPAKLPVRPTTDRAKEALFNWLDHRFELRGATAIDLFSGTGNIAYELGSRGAGNITAVDQHAGCCRYIRETATLLQLPISVLQADVFAWIQKAPTSALLVFADPPYDHPRLPELPALVLQKGLRESGGVFILEHPKHRSFEQHPALTEQRVYGQSVFSIFEDNPLP
ncbi:MAG: 16S rRNA (guanine(966)-N(2))-methyltransferase RsmD [Sphingobacteriaceae bacterium]|nr:16S rRNA (guanine(966)-N(2))-methyltransferase RsmD [Sphingobacteriaceae bacterium]